MQESQQRHVSESFSSCPLVTVLSCWLQADWRILITPLAICPSRCRVPSRTTAHLLRNLRWLCSYTDQVLAQLDLLRNLLAPCLQERRLPPDEKAVTLHLPALNVELTVLAQDRADYERSKVEGPFQPAITVTASCRMNSIESAEIAPPCTRNSAPPAHKPPAFTSSSARRLWQEPFDERSARMFCAVNPAPRNMSSSRP